MYHCETFGFSGFRAKETMIQESTTGILATDGTRIFDRMNRIHRIGTRIFDRMNRIHRIGSLRRRFRLHPFHPVNPVNPV